MADNNLNVVRESGNSETLVISTPSVFEPLNLLQTPNASTSQLPSSGSFTPAVEGAKLLQSSGSAFAPTPSSISQNDELSSIIAPVPLGGHSSSLAVAQAQNANALLPKPNAGSNHDPYGFGDILSSPTSATPSAASSNNAQSFLPFTPSGLLDLTPSVGAPFASPNKMMGVSNASQPVNAQLPQAVPSNIGNNASIMAPNGMIKIVEGFNKNVIDEQPGGKTNVKDALPRQAVELCIPNTTPDQVANLHIKVHVLGYDKGSGTYKVIEENIGESKFIEVGPHKKYVAIFSQLICKHSSHLNGQKLALRFSLYNGNNPNPISSADSMDFKTLTKRGTQKRRQKRKKSDAEPQISVISVHPAIGPTTGGQYVKIVGNGFSCPPVGNIIVKFGERPAREVFCIKRNMILCETPEGEQGSVDVKVSFDKQNYIPTDAKYQYVSAQNAALFVKHIFQPSGESMTPPNNIQAQPMQQLHHHQQQFAMWPQQKM